MDKPASLLILAMLVVPVRPVLAQPGSLDPTFASGSAASADILDLVLLPDGKLVIGGSFGIYDDTPVSNFTRLTATGDLDPTFAPDAIDGWVREVARQSDGKYVISGDFDHIAGVPRAGLARLHEDGTLDTSFDPGTGANQTIYEIVVLSSGKIMIGGTFTQFNGAWRYRLARLNTDGSLDPTFDPEEGGNYAVYTILEQPGGKVLVGGSFDEWNLDIHRGIVRLDANGEVDDSFDAGGGFIDEAVGILLQQPDGKILAAGGFSLLDGETCNQVARLHPDGARDTGFDAGSGPTGLVYSMALQLDGAIILGGEFLSFSGPISPNLVRLHSNGELDTDFMVGDGPHGSDGGGNGHVYECRIQPNGQLVIAGDFHSYGDVARGNIARVYTDGSSEVPTFGEYEATNPTLFLSTTTLYECDARLGQEVQLRILDMAGRVVFQIPGYRSGPVELRREWFSPGIYSLAASSNRGSMAVRMVVE